MPPTVATQLCRAKQQAKLRLLADYHGVRTGTVPVFCWCEAEVVRVDPAEVRRGVTGSCGPGCRERAAA